MIKNLLRISSIFIKDLWRISSRILRSLLPRIEVTTIHTHTHIYIYIYIILYYSVLVFWDCYAMASISIHHPYKCRQKKQKHAKHGNGNRPFKGLPTEPPFICILFLAFPCLITKGYPATSAYNWTSTLVASFKPEIPSQCWMLWSIFSPLMSRWSDAWLFLSRIIATQTNKKGKPGNCR